MVHKGETRLAGLFVLACLCLPSIALSDDSLPLWQPRLEAGIKLGNQRTIGGASLWLPLRQNHDSLLYTDLRLVGDNQNSHEGNLGVGYRHLTSLNNTPVVLGAHGWLDRRHTGLHNTFWQSTLGAEMLTEDFDLRLNGYVPMTRRQALDGSFAVPSLTGTGITYDSFGTIYEEAQSGFDAEVGVRLPVKNPYIESLRLYGGTFHFYGDDSPDMHGWRTRLRAEMSHGVVLGTSFQTDNIRGDQGFLEATFRFPVRGAAQKNLEGLKARMAESPERDIDVVAGITPRPTTVDDAPVLNIATGDPQRVVHVDNTATPGGDGSVTAPFDTLAAAQAVLQAEDILYIHSGSGTTGMDQGLTITMPGVRVIGAGRALAYDTDYMTTGSSIPLRTTLLRAAGTAPTITNLQASSNNVTGAGVLVQADRVNLEGFNVTGNTGHGVYASNDTGTTWSSLGINDVNLSSNGKNGIRLETTNSGSRIQNVTINDVATTSTGRQGVLVFVQAATTMNEVSINDVSVSGTAASSGIEIISSGTAGSPGRIDSVQLNRIESSLAAINGVSLTISGNNSGSSIGVVEADGIDTHHNTFNGVSILLARGNTLEELHLSDVQSAHNSNTGISLSTGGIATIQNFTIEDSQILENLIGISLLTDAVAGPGGISNGIMDNLTIAGNTQHGLYARLQANNAITNVGLQNSRIYDNLQNGVYLEDTSSSTMSLDLGGGAAGSLGNNSLYDNGSSNPVTYADLATNASYDTATTHAQSNWWGQAGGPLAGQVINLGSGTVDTSDALNAAPNQEQ